VTSVQEAMSPNRCMSLYRVVMVGVGKCLGILGIFFTWMVRIVGLQVAVRGI
jgi:hypothetical protein